MIFNSLEFPLFFAGVFLLYWFVFSKTATARNLFIIAVSYFFYGCFDWRFAVLLAVVNLVTYATGLLMSRTEGERQRNRVLGLSLVLLLGTLGVFKYYNFFVENVSGLLRSLGWSVQGGTLNLLLPVGISFYTFLSIGYVLDVYWRKVEPVKEADVFFAFACFFPQLSAGPVERASNMLPQFRVKPQFSHEQASDGMRQVLWGLFKKVVVADNCAVYVNDIFANYQTLSGVELAFGTGLYAMQLYCDFSGYSDMAIGVAKLLGIRLMVNFNYPYFSKNITEFWRRWHISLSTWFRDYLFTPMAIALRNWNLAGVVVSMLVSFLLIGLWHGANWNYLVFGGLHGLMLTFEMLTKKRRKQWKKSTPAWLYENGSMLLTFLAWCLTLVFFRNPNFGVALDYIGQVFSSRFMPENFRFFNLFTLLMVLVVILADWFFQKKEHPLLMPNLPAPVRWSVYLAMGFFIFNFIQNKQPFIYFAH